MSDIEGINEAIRLFQFSMDYFFKFMGWTTNKTIKGIAKINDYRKERIKLAMSLKERDEFLAGGSATLEEIFKEKGELPDKTYHLKIKSWDDKLAKSFIKHCEDVGVKIVPLKDMDPSDDKIQFLIHSSDVGRLEAPLNSLTNEALLNKQIESKENMFKVENSEDYYKSLSDYQEREQEIKNTILKAQNDKEVMKISQEMNKNFVEEALKSDVNEKKVKSAASKIPTDKILVDDKVVNIVTESGIVSINKELVSTISKDTAQIFIDPKSIYNFKNAKGEIAKITGKELLDKIKPLENELVKRLDSLRKTNISQKTKDLTKNIQKVITK